MVPDLSRITAVADMLDHPERTYPSIHITGTNGKTTTARLITSLACAHGLTTGTYTSPHLQSVTERLSVCGDPISEDDFAVEYERLLPYLREVDGKGERVTYFETLTALAYLWFSDKPISLGVFEVGMGGVWDATNLITGDVAVLCPVGLDHPELGPTVKDVATEKAGIIKEGKIAVSREQADQALRVVKERCKAVSAGLLLEGRDFALEERVQAIGGQVLRVQGVRATYEDLAIPLFGEHAARNAAAAVVALEAFLGRALSAEVTREALANVTSPGRLEVVNRHPLVVLDGAHNPAGAEALSYALPEAFAWDRLHLVLAISSNKDILGIVRELARLHGRAYVTRNSTTRSASPEAVLAACQEAGIQAEEYGSVPEALAAARSEAFDEDLILVTGSLYTVADAREALLPHV
jgi:dihydrofolate synthase / folylpolyglutamate synthase